MAKTSKKIEARERARQARVRLDAERARRDEQIEDAAAAFFTSTDQEQELREKLAAIVAEQDRSIGDLLDLGETQKRIADLLEIPPSRVREVSTARARGAQVSEQSDATESPTADAGGEHQSD